ncbi:MAG: NTP transferase domain-containing protein [Planctomycetes bacterium]|nr:NTP transferase domain-containing protein [Planctomycetota bacterium]
MSVKIMKCLILAAGKGSRLAARGDSKPLVSFLGLTLIERAILAAQSCGLTEFYVVTGCNGEKVRVFLDKFSREKNLNITHVINEDWEKENGLSVLKAKELLDEKFILMMVDHLFDRDILVQLTQQQIQDGEVILAVDSNVNSNSLVDIDDVTKVHIEDGKILDIGKDVSEYNAFDTGFFLCSPSIFAAIETSIDRNNDSTLSGGIRILADTGAARALDVSGNFWMDLDDDNAFRKAQKSILGKLTKFSDGPVSRYLNRPISTRITRFLVKTKVTPNQISFFSFLLCVISSVLFLKGGYATLLAGAVLAQIASIIDGCDGEIARLKYQSTAFGGWFDAVLDRYADAFLLFGLICHIYFLNDNFLYIIVGFLALTGTFMNSYTADKYDTLMKKRLGPEDDYFRIGRDVRIAIIFLGALINQIFLILLIIGIVTNVENVRRVLILGKDEKKRMCKKED